MDKILDDDKLMQLRKTMPKGYLKILSQNAKCSKSNVVCFFKNRIKDLDITERILTEALKLKSEIDAKKIRFKERLEHI